MIGQVLLDSHATVGIRYLTMGAGKIPWCLIHGITTQLNSLLAIAAKIKDELYLHKRYSLLSFSPQI